MRGLTEFRAGRDGEREPDDERVEHDAQLQHLRARAEVSTDGRADESVETHQDPDDLPPPPDRNLRPVLRLHIPVPVPVPALTFPSLLSHIHVY